MQVSNINTTIISNNELSNITSHTTKPTLTDYTSTWNGSALKTTEANAQLKFLDKLIHSVDQDIGKKIEKRETKKEGYLKMSICGPGQSNEYLSVSVKDGNNFLNYGLAARNKGHNSNTWRYTSGELKHNEKLEFKVEYESGHPLFQDKAEDNFEMKCEDGRPFIEVGQKEGEVFFSSGCDKARERCKSYNEWQPDTGSSCSIL